MILNIRTMSSRNYNEKPSIGSRSRMLKVVPGLVVLMLIVAPAFAATDTYSTNGNWAAPVGVTSVTVEAWAGGGGGAGGAGANGQGGGGGGGGQFVRHTVSVSGGNTYNVVVGVGGTAGGSGGAGGAGGNSTFDGATVVAVGGTGGNAGATGAGGVGGTGGGWDVSFDGGSGGPLASNTVAGAGGGGAGSTGTGGDGDTGTAVGTGGTPDGGDGGAGSSVNNGPGTAGATYGGGGGAGTRNGVGGDGGAGFVRLTYTPPANNPPSLTINQPAGGDDAVTQGASFSIDYDLADTEDTATVDFYYETDGNGAGGTLIAACAGQPEGAGVPCAWDTTSITPGNYYVYGVADDGVNTVVTVVSSGVLTINAPGNNSPVLSINQPDGVGDAVAQGASFIIDYDLSDAEDTATVDFYYETDGNGAGGTLIAACAGQPEGVGQTCGWDTTLMTPGDYYVYGVADDGVNALVTVVSAGVLTINAPAGTNTTAAGTASASKGNAVIDVSAPYSNDDNLNNSITISWGEGDCLTGNQTSGLHPVSPYSYQISGLVNGTTYQVCVDYNDADGVTGIDPQTLTGLTPTAFNPMIHSSLSTGSSKWGGDWGTATGKYGEFSCGTCHSRNTGNIKRVKKTLNSGTVDKFPVEADVGTVNFLDTRNGSSDFGNDLGGHAVSDKVCEGCHSQNKYHNYNTVNNTDGLTHENLNDCVTCHQHSKGFGASCDACHGNPPVTNDTSTTGLVFDPATTDATNPVSAGGHQVHAVTMSMACITCHKGNTMPTVSNTIQMGFEVNNANWNGFGDTATTGTLDAPDEGAGQMSASFNFVSSSAGTTINKVANNNLTCAVYCHGNWAGNGGQTATSWVGGLTMADDCNDCHGGSTATPPTAGSHQQHAGNGAGDLALACTACHPAYSDAVHVDGDVAWDVSALSGTPTYSGSATGLTGGKAPSGSYATCAGLYCHSSGQSADGTGTTPYVQATPTWGGGAVCGSCHHVTTVAGLTTGSHGKHLAAAGIGCDDCHTGAAADASSYVSANHVNELIDAANSYTAGGTPGNGYGLCTNASCHDNGTGTTVNSPTWGQAGGCASCHASDMATGSHSRHLSTTVYAKAVCGDCHDGAVKDTTAPAEHTDGNLDVYDASAGDLGYPTVNANGNGYESCSTAYCHSSGQSLSNGSSAVPTYDTVTWGGAAACGSCHAVAGLTSGGHAKHLAAAGVGCDDCHTGAAADASTYNATTHVDGAIDAANSYNAGGTPGNGYGLCTNASCHDNGTGTTVDSPTWGQSGGCASCHPSDMTTASHATHLGQTISPAISCGNCHDGAVKDSTAPSQHIDGNLDVFDSVAGDLGYPTNVAKGGAPYSSCTTTYCHGDAMPNGDTTGSDTTPLWGASSTGCGFCHGFPPTPAGIHNGITAENQCGQCHDQTMTNTQTGFTNIALHINGVVDVNVSCTGCHSGSGANGLAVGVDSPHSTNTIAGNPTCESCHFADHGSRTSGTFGIAWDSRTMGADYTVDGKIYIVGSGSEAESCWACHEGETPDVSEWDGSNAVYDYGSVTANDLNWFTTSWSSANFNYKSGKLTTAMGSGASTHGTNGGAAGVDVAGAVSCTSCHDVHGINHNGVSTTSAPYLRGSWKASAYNEDGAPGEYNNSGGGSGTSTYQNLGNYGVVPRASNATTNGMGGFWIDQNSGSPANGTYATHAGLCTLCHGDGDTVPAEATDVTAIESLWIGHKNSVAGGNDDGSAARNIFSNTIRIGDGVWNSNGGGAYMGNQSFVTPRDTKPWAGSIRNADYGDGVAPLVSGKALAFNNFAWGVSVDNGSVDSNFHSFSCSKCHNPHASRLPKLMITNCLDTSQNSWDNAYTGDANWGNNNYASQTYGTKELAKSSTAQNCHRYVSGQETSGWNSVTPW